MFLRLNTSHEMQGEVWYQKLRIKSKEKLFDLGPTRNMITESSHTSLPQQLFLPCFRFPLKLMLFHLFLSIFVTALSHSTPAFHFFSKSQSSFLLRFDRPWGQSNQNVASDLFHAACLQNSVLKNELKSWYHQSLFSIKCNR